MPNIVLCFIKRLLFGNGELLSFFFKELESVAVLSIWICTSFLLWWVYVFHCKSQNNGAFKNWKALSITMMPP